MPIESSERDEGGEPAPVSARQSLMALCGAARADELRTALTVFGETVEVEDLRAPEIGLVMARGRIGGDGRPFNLGEVTVTRAAIRLADGRTGFAYHLGRDRAKARLAATLDALWQGSSRDRETLAAALTPVAARVDGERAQARRRTAATRVDFFTMVRGED